VTCFDVSRAWTSKELYDNLRQVIPVNKRFIPFEIVKNSASSLIQPTLPSGNTRLLKQ